MAIPDQTRKPVGRRKPKKRNRCSTSVTSNDMRHGHFLFVGLQTGRPVLPKHRDFQILLSTGHSFYVSATYTRVQGCFLGQNRLPFSPQKEQTSSHWSRFWAPRGTASRNASHAEFTCPTRRIHRPAGTAMEVPSRWATWRPRPLGGHRRGRETQGTGRRGEFKQRCEGKRSREGWLG